MGKRSVFFLCFLLAVVLAFVPGCDWFGSGAGDDDGSTDLKPLQSLVEQVNESGKGFFYRLPDLPAPVREWVDNAADNLYLGQSRVFGEYLYILVTYGPQPTGGYAVEITEVQVGPEAVEVQVVFSKPGPDDVVTQGFTYPYDLALIPAVDLPVVFNPRGAEEYLMSLYGIEYLEPITASSYGIKLFAPAEGDSVNSMLQFRGAASVFEGTISYRLSAVSGKLLAEGFTTAGMGDWYYFEETIPLVGLIEGTVPANLELFTLSPKDGSEQDLISVALTLAP